MYWKTKKLCDSLYRNRYFIVVVYLQDLPVLTWRAHTHASVV